MAITTTTTLSSTNIVGSQVVKKFNLAFVGTYVAATGIVFTAAQFGLDTVDFIVPVIDGSSAFTNGAFIVAPDLAGLNFQLIVTGASDGTALHELTDGQTVTGFSVNVLVYGVA